MAGTKNRKMKWVGTEAEYNALSEGTKALFHPPGYNPQAAKKEKVGNIKAEKKVIAAMLKVPDAEKVLAARSERSWDNMKDDEREEHIKQIQALQDGNPSTDDEIKKAWDEAVKKYVSGLGIGYSARKFNLDTVNGVSRKRKAK